MVTLIICWPRRNKNSVARCGLISAKWLIWELRGGQKKVAISHQDVAYFEEEKWLKWLISPKSAKCGLMWLILTKICWIWSNFYSKSWKTGLKLVNFFACSGPYIFLYKILPFFAPTKILRRLRNCPQHHKLSLFAASFF